MNTLIKDLTDWTRQHGGHEKRSYLGLSQLHKSEDDLLSELINGTPDIDDDSVLLLSMGYVIENDIRRRLQGIGVAIPDTQKEIVAHYDARVRGHIDGLTCMPQQIYEIKSTKQEKLDYIIQSNKLPTKDFMQIQAYLHHGKYKSCLVLYVARDTGKFWMKELWYIPAIGRQIEEKARRVLQVYDMMKNDALIILK
ncbi:hypothetical protein [Runella salmonicolor]|uniref:YqaJ viral recombinase domain-containing protein n=1 Tax=Runella salmonicolor TaxID=2950278 RepID=A0ABT1FW10_9BACT|nr:hypothetical protein [Runella salmonicolor]MCP1384858.1 hypothetical protein [Runella salmonicolor]